MSYSLKIRWKIIESIKKGKRISYLSYKTGIPARTIRRWFSKYKREGIKGFVPNYGEFDRLVCSIKEEKPWVTLKEIKKFL